MNRAALSPRHVNKLISIPLGLLMIGMGVAFILRGAGELLPLIRLLTAALFVTGAVLLVKGIWNTIRQGKLTGEWGSALIDLGAATALLIIRPSALADALPFFAAIWVAGAGAMKLVLSWQYKQSGMTYWFVTALTGAVFLMLGVLLAVNGVTRTVLLGAAIGSLLVAVGGSTILEALFPERHGRLNLQDKFLFGRAFSPNSALQMIRGLVQDSKLNPDPLSRAPCEILVHLCDTRFDSLFGHVDITVGDTVYTYGNYDSFSNKLGGAVSDGLLAVMPRAPYIDYSLSHEKKVLVAYAVRFDGAQMKKLQAFLDGFTTGDQQFTPLALDKCPDGTQDSASLMQHFTKGSMFKPGNRLFRTYFAIGTNCVRFVDEAIARAGVARHHVAGVLMPGDYLSMLEKELKREGGFVTGRSVYTNQAV